MADLNLIATSVDAGSSFKSASRTSPVMTIHVKPDVIPKIISNLETLKGRTDDSEISQKGSTYTFTDKRNGLPLAELDTAAGTLAMYKSPKDMAARIDSAFISAKSITDFIAESRVEKPVAAAPAQAPGNTLVAAK